MDNRPIFIFIHAKTCGTCKSYMPQWEKHKSEISKVARVIEIELNTTKDQLPSNYPIGLSRYRRWFPMFLLIPASQWTMNGNINAAVFNAADDGKDIRFTGEMDYSLLPTWVAGQLKNNVMFKPQEQVIVQSQTAVQPQKVPEVCGLVLGRYF